MSLSEPGDLSRTKYKPGEREKEGGGMRRTRSRLKKKKEEEEEQQIPRGATKGKQWSEEPVGLRRFSVVKRFFTNKGPSESTQSFTFDQRFNGVPRGKSLTFFLFFFFLLPVHVFVCSGSGPVGVDRSQQHSPRWIPPSLPPRGPRALKGPAGSHESRVPRSPSPLRNLCRSPAWSSTTAANRPVNQRLITMWLWTKRRNCTHGATSACVTHKGSEQAQNLASGDV